ncbi:histone acetyltransferase 1 [Clonorchis sinensis]|uniref:Histone acetyltransferase 1 n=1 Tax=Clonorchis sinensis TaxID=79923 RepID=G7YTA4_CLOSI|nr:histone acetyltransferase 1 [Clonorchis sinensis]
MCLIGVCDRFAFQDLWEKPYFVAPIYLSGSVSKTSYSEAEEKSLSYRSSRKPFYVKLTPFIDRSDGQRQLLTGFLTAAEYGVRSDKKSPVYYTSENNSPSPAEELMFNSAADLLLTSMPSADFRRGLGRQPSKSPLTATPERTGTYFRRNPAANHEMTSIDEAVNYKESAKDFCSKYLENGSRPAELTSGGVRLSIKETFPYKFDRSLVDFFQTFHSDTFKPYGTIRHTYKRTTGSKQTKKFCVYFIEHGMPDFDAFLDYHKKMESFLLFFVDGASAIPTDDTQWCYYTLFEVIDPQQDGEAYLYAFIGYMTIFKFYAYPANLRPRLSQVLILPPFRNNGHASELLQTFYRDFVHVPNVRDITGKVEDPSDDFRRIRDFIDCKRCLEQTEIMDLLKQATANGSSLTIPQKSCYLAFRDKAQQCLKLSRCQAKRVYEILQLHQLPRSPEAVQLFRNALLKRVKSNYEGSTIGLGRLRCCSNRMHGRGADRRNTAGGSQSLRNLIDEVADECYSLQINEFVDQEMSAYQCIVTKLDRHFGRTNVTNGPSTS